MKVHVYEVPLTLAIHHSDIKIKDYCTNPSVILTTFCACNRLSNQVSVYSTIGPLVYFNASSLTVWET